VPQLWLTPQLSTNVLQFCPLGHDVVVGTQASASGAASLASAPASLAHTTWSSAMTGVRCHDRTHLFWQSTRTRSSSSSSLSEQISRNVRVVLPAQLHEPSVDDAVSDRL
jgi:hypothetical protein